MPAEEEGPAAEDLAALLVDLTLARAPGLGAGRLLCIDGPAGSGKTTLAGAVARLATDATVIHTDELLEGWSGLPRLAGTVASVLRPLAEGRASRWTRWDWHASRWAESHPVRPGGLLVLEGVGSWSPAIARWVTALVWVEAPHDVRMRRGIERDGDTFAPYWEQWARDEALVFDRDGTRDHADLVVVTG